MTQLIIAGLTAELPEGASFSYFEESVYFEDAGGYTLDMELPLRGSAANREIFGFIERQPPSSASWPATLILDGLAKEGTALLTDVNQTTVKIQFVAGKSTEAYSRLERTFINEMDLNDRIEVYDLNRVTGIDPAVLMLSSYDLQAVSPFVNNKFWTQLWKVANTGFGPWIPSVALPWYNETDDQLHNWIDLDTQSGSIIDWPTRKTGLCWMPYLLPLAKRIAESAGYTPYFTQWESSYLRNLIVCNTTPPEEAPLKYFTFRRSLPHWSVIEFFKNIQPLLNGIFSFDHLQKTISFTTVTASNRKEVEITEVEDDFKITSSYGMEETDGNYLRSKPYRYADLNSEEWKSCDCPWLINSVVPEDRMEFETYEEFLNYMRANGRKKSTHNKIFYVADLKAWFCYDAHTAVVSAGSGIDSFKFRVEAIVAPKALNIFGPEDNTGTDESFQELQVLPVLDDGRRIQLSPSGCFDALAYLMDGGSVEDFEESDPDDTVIISAPSKRIAEKIAEEQGLIDNYQTPILDRLEEGEGDESAAYDHLFVGYWPGQSSASSQIGKIDLPQTYGFHYSGLSVSKEFFSMRLTEGDAPYSGMPRIDESIKYTFGFLADTIPDVNSIFYIHGRRWICKRLETQFSARGRSRRISGEFYPII